MYDQVRNTKCEFEPRINADMRAANYAGPDEIRLSSLIRVYLRASAAKIGFRFVRGMHPQLTAVDASLPNASWRTARVELNEQSQLISAMNQTHTIEKPETNPLFGASRAQPVCCAR